MTFDGSGYSKTTYANGNIYINDSYSTLHEAVHAMGIIKNGNIWLREGLCDYFGKSLGFNDQIAASYIQLLTMAKQGYFDEQATSLVLYLVDTYGIETVLEAYRSQDIATAFGKGYEDLKTDWLTFFMLKLPLDQ